MEKDRFYLHTALLRSLHCKALVPVSLAISCAFFLIMQNNILDFLTSLYEIAASLPVFYQMRRKCDLSILCFALASKTAAAFKCLQTNLETCLDNLTLLKYILYLSIRKDCSRMALRWEHVATQSSKRVGWIKGC